MTALKAPDLATMDQIAHELNVTTRTLRNWQRYHGMPVIAIGKTRRFDREHVIEWVKSRERNAPAITAVAA